MEENGGGSANGDNFPLPEITSAALYVGNLPYNARWQQLKDHFKEIGN
jgi:RNA recognition motif-containing protein